MEQHQEELPGSTIEMRYFLSHNDRCVVKWDIEDAERNVVMDGTSDDRIIDIAIAAGFESQQSFTRAFRATFDITPSAYCQLGDKSLFFKKVQFDETYLHHVSPDPAIYHQPSTIFVGLPTVFFNVDSEKTSPNNYHRCGTHFYRE